MPRVVALFALVVALLPPNAQHRQRSAPDLLNHALYLAELYNWTAAGPEFSQAEKIFVAAGDQRNALYARLGRLRSTVEQGALPGDLDPARGRARDEPTSPQRPPASG